MTDLEITKLCAEAMGLPGAHAWEEKVYGRYSWWLLGFPFLYDPLNDDAQAMALVKRFALSIGGGTDGWECWFEDDQDDLGGCWTKSDSLNRAICECVAKMEKERGNG